MPEYGIIKEVFPSKEDIINDDAETNIIEEPEEDPSIPTEDEDTGEGGSGLPVQMELGNTIEPDSNDIIWPIEEIELDEPEVEADEYEVEPVVTNQALLPTLGAVAQGDRVVIALVNGEATVIGTVGWGDAQNNRISAVEQVAGDTNQYFWHTTTGTDTGAHITQIPQEEFITTPSGGNTLIRSNGMAIRDGLTELSRFASSGIQIGQDNQSRVVLDYHSFQQIDKEDNYYVYFSDLRDTEGYANIVENFTGDGSNRLFTLLFPVVLNKQIEVLVDGITQDYYEILNHSLNAQLHFQGAAPASGAVITITYYADSQNTKAYTLGIRDASGKVGAMSYAEGLDNIASGYLSHAEGYSNQAVGYYSHAEGYNTYVGGGYAHAEGYNTISGNSASHAEGNNTGAYGIASHAEGYGTSALGTHSHAGGNQTIAAGNQQTAIGKFNVSDSSSTYALIIGNGADANNRNNALTVDWNGNITCGLVNGVDVTQGGGGGGAYLCAVLTGTIPTSSGWGSYIALPSGYTINNSIIASFQIAQSDGIWREIGVGAFSSSFKRTFAEMSADGVRVYNTDTNSEGNAFRITLMRTTGTGSVYTAGSGIDISNNEIAIDNTVALKSEIPTATSDLTNDSGFISGYTETDPVFTSSAAHSITSTNVSLINQIYTDGYIPQITLYTPSGANYSYLTRRRIYQGTSTDTPLLYVYPTITSATDNNTIPSMKAVKDALDAKQDTLTAGSGITIDSNNVISATGGGGGGGGATSLTISSTVLGQTTANGTLTLSDSLANYDYILLNGYAGSNILASSTYPMDYFKNPSYPIRVTANDGTNRRVQVDYASDTTLTISNRASLNLEVVGIKHTLS